MIKDIEFAFLLKACVLLFLILIFKSTGIKSQSLIDPTFFQKKEYNSFVSIDGISGYDSDIIKREMAWSFLAGGFLSRDIRNNSVPKNDNTKRIGAEISAGLTFTFPAQKVFGKDSLNLIFSLSQDQSYAINLNKNAFELFFFGNERFRGETISLDNFYYNNWGFRSLGIGVLNRKNNASLSLNFYQGLTHDQYALDNGILSTAEDGRFITADLEGTLFDNRYNEANRNSTNGFGIGIDGRIDLLGKRNDSKLFLNIRDAGVMIWPTGVQKVSIDSSYYFEGVLFNELFSPGANMDTIPVLNSVFSTEKIDADRIEMLPTRLEIDFLKPLNSKTTMEIIVQSYSINRWRPEIQIGLLKSISHNLIIGGLLKYGGNGNANLNVLCSYAPSTNFEINAKISYLSGWLVDAGYGSHVNIGIKRYFNLLSKVE